MATYTLIQDIEAEDHVLGPLTLRQFIFAMITVFLLYVCFLVTSQGAAFLLVIFLPPTIFFGFFALPLGRDQPTEVWALAKIRFLFKPRKRIWNQSGVKELVTITAPKKVEPVRTDGLSQYEVSSRLQALASTLDSRGWAVKNVDVNAFAVPASMQFGALGSDRLIDSESALPQAVPDAPVTAADDMLDPANNRVAHQFDAMIAQSSQARRQGLMDELNRPADAAAPAGAPAASNTPQADYWFMQNSQEVPQPAVPAPSAASIDPAEEAALTAQLKAQHDNRPAPTSHLRTMQPLGAQPTVANPTPVPAAASQPVGTVTPPTDPAILSLADNDDLNVATLAREAQRGKREDTGDGEVVIPLR